MPRCAPPGPEGGHLPCPGWTAGQRVGPSSDAHRPGGRGFQESYHAEILIKLSAPLINFTLALLSAAILILVYPNLIFPGFGLPWLAPIALVPLLIALAREPRPLWRFLLGEFAGIVYWFAICYWIQFVLEVHGGMGRWGGWGTFLLFCLAKALHLAVFSLLAAVVLRTWYAVPAVAALWTGIERTHGTFGFSWLTLGNAALDMTLPLR